MSRVLIAGLGDSGLLTAVRLTRHADVVGITTKPAHVSGQEVGVRLTRPEEWSVDYWIDFDRYRGLDRARVVHGTMTGLDLDRQVVTVQSPAGAMSEEPYDVLVISTGVSNGFWRRPTLDTVADVSESLREPHERLAKASSIAVIGGGAAAVSTAANLKASWPDKQVDLYFPGEQALAEHHRKVWSHVASTIGGVGLHPGHRAVVPEGFALDAITDDPVAFSTGQDPVTADAVVWAIGRVTPNTGWLPAELLDDDGYVVVDPTLGVPGRPGVFAVGDVAATDPLRGSARNRADRLLAKNIRAHLGGQPLTPYKPVSRRWGAILGNQPDGLTVYDGRGRVIRFPAWFNRAIVRPWLVGQGIYLGVRRRLMGR